MLLIDFSHLCHRYIFTCISKAKVKKENGIYKTEDYIGLLYHGILTNLIYLKGKFSNYGSVVLCCEGKNSWRKQFYPEYKASRIKDSTIDFETLYKHLDEFTQSLKDYFGVYVLKFDGAEGDDVIATIANDIETNHIIVSSDKDFKQLLRLENVKIFDPMKKEFLTYETFNDIENVLKEHIICGDSSDNIPNVLAKEKFTPEFLSFLRTNDLFVETPREFFKLKCADSILEKYDVYETYKSGKNKGKQKETKAVFQKVTLTKSKIEEIKKRLESNEDSWLKECYEFNEKLIDFRLIPFKIRQRIINGFNNTELKNPEPMEIMNFCLKHRLTDILKTIQVFYTKTEDKINDFKEW